MFSLIIIVILLMVLLVFMNIKLKHNRQRLWLIISVFLGMLLVLVIWYKWSIYQGRINLIAETNACRAQRRVEGLMLFFDGFTRNDLADSAYTEHKNNLGILLDRGRQRILKIDQLEGNKVSVTYDYRYPFAVDDTLKINIGKKKYTLSNFVMTSIVHGVMLGAPKAYGCNIDSADINGIRTPFVQHMFIRKTDRF